MPEWEDGKYIWQRTITTKWEYQEVDKTDEEGNPVTDEDGNIIKVNLWVDTVASDKIVCLAGASAASYWLNCSTKLHTGEQQTENIVVTAMMKVGTGAEQGDKTAIIEYR